MRRVSTFLALVFATTLLSLACGSITNTTTAPSLLDPSQPRTPPDISITSAGVQPVVAHVDHPVTITFTNDDTVAHRLESAPDLGWDDCPEMHGLAPIKPGERLAVAFGETDAVCAYHDASQPANVAFQGYVAIH